MPAPVWVLSVDLQTKTATFQSNVAAAAKSARGSFSDIQSGARSMAEGASEGFLNVRASLGILDNSIRGNHAAAMADMIRLFSQSSVVMSALPIAATAGGILLLGGVVLSIVKALQEWREAQEKLRSEETQFGTALQTTFNGLDEKLLQAGIRADELRNDHLGALRNELQLIDMQSMDELIRTFGEIDKAADTVFKDLKSHWYTFGIGSAGASHALDQFKTQYDSLLSQGKDSQATDLLKGTLSSAKGVLALQKEALANKPSGEIDSDEKWEQAEKFHTAINELKKSGVGYSDKEVAAQQALVDALSAQVSVEQKVSALKKTDSGNATKTAGNEMASMHATAARAAADHSEKMGELALAAEREQATVAQTLHNVTIQQRLASDIALADKEYAIQSAANAQQIAALNKGGKDYENQLKALQDKEEELVAQHGNTIAELKGKAAIQQYQKDIADMDEAEREKIDATRQGSAARLAVIDAALKAEEAKGLGATEHYRELMEQRVEVARQVAQEEAKAIADGAKEAADNQLKVGMLALAAEKGKQALLDSARRVTRQQAMEEAIKAANEETALKMTALSQEIAGLDKSGKDYETKLRQLQDQQKQLVQEHENEITQIQEKAQIERNNSYRNAMVQMETESAQGLLSVLAGHRSFAAEMDGILRNVTQNIISAAIQQMNGIQPQKLANAKLAASNVYAQVSGWPVVGPFLAPELAAAAFTGVMAFAQGGIVPGVGKGDIVPAMLEPGEAIIKKSAVDRLNNEPESLGARHITHVVHMRPVFHVQALDSEGMDRVLEKHSAKLQKHYENTVRRMNRR